MGGEAGGEVGVIAVTRVADKAFEGPDGCGGWARTTVRRQVVARPWIENAQGSQCLMWRPCPRVGCRRSRWIFIGGAYWRGKVANGVRVASTSW
jgi:hypothetical protein